MLERIAYKGPATIWAISSRDARELETLFGRPAHSVQTILHGVDSHRFSPDARLQRRTVARTRLEVERRRVLLLVANDARNKGVDTAVRILNELPDDVVLAVAGKVDTSLGREWAVQSGVREGVCFLPHLPEVLEYLASVDVFVEASATVVFNPSSM